MRNLGEDLDGIVRTYGLDRDRIEKRLKEAGFEYLPEIHQFR